MLTQKHLPGKQQEVSGLPLGQKPALSPNSESGQLDAWAQRPGTPRPLRASACVYIWLLKLYPDWSAWGPWWKESHGVTDVGLASELSTGKRCVFTPRPNKCQFQSFSLKIPIFYKVVTCDIFPKSYYENIQTKKSEYCYTYTKMAKI